MADSGRGTRGKSVHRIVHAVVLPTHTPLHVQPVENMVAMHVHNVFVYQPPALCSLRVEHQCALCNVCIAATNLAGRE